ncbi:SLC13 family permease [Rothia kristinae]|uniref:SLC13 family permease n=1 Tax=Rothia kristinae TaxID=37923 RepID=UPI0022B7907F|nr:SLC13 family permease [Rothia kristinae]
MDLRVARIAARRRTPHTPRSTRPEPPHRPRPAPHPTTEGITVDPVQTLSLALLALALILAIWRRINIGLLALAATFVLALTAHLTADDVYDAFPGSIFVLLVGVSLLFGHLERSGALTWFVDRVYRLIGERTHLIPWAGFLIGAVLSSLGAFATAPSPCSCRPSRTCPAASPAPSSSASSPWSSAPTPPDSPR